MDFMATSDSDFLLKGLNDAQSEAVGAPLQNMLIVAGAGTGKTRVLVSRVSWLLKVENIPARNILTVTFTNKAAAEMRQRIGELVGENVLHALWSCTFHSLCLRLLRAYSSRAGLSSDFSILDTEGQKLLIKRIEKDLGIDIKEYKPAQLASAISTLKEKGLRADDFLRKRNSRSELQNVLGRVYPVYEESCKQEDLVDFSELLLRTLEMLKSHDELRDLLQRRFKEILVDEFQDTNVMQYELLKLLSGKETHVLAVGDDDQSIYGWRGADFANMQRFGKEFSQVKTIALQKNYRSTQNILDVANVLISGNDNRLIQKELHGVHGQGYRVEFLHNSSGYFESVNIGNMIASMIKRGVRARDIAVLYRNNSLSAAIESELSNRGIPYAVYGGLKFFDRAEIQDALAYLRILLNDADDTALLRIINVPSRKLGPKVVENLRRIAQDRKCSAMQAIALVCEYGSQNGAPKELASLAKKLVAFGDLIRKLKSLKENSSSLAELVKGVIEESGLYEYYRLKDEKEQRGVYDNQRHLNLEQLVSNAVSFEAEAAGQSGEEDDLEQEERVSKANASKDSLLNFISSVSLAAGTELSEGGLQESVPDTVNLMTIHSSKGLEFRYVFIVGFDKSVLPSSISESRGDISEERRLAYVGITRAVEQLCLSYSDKRLFFGKMEVTGPSPFLQEIAGYYAGSSGKPFEVMRS